MKTNKRSEAAKRRWERYRKAKAQKQAHVEPTITYEQYKAFRQKYEEEVKEERLAKQGYYAHRLRDATLLGLFGAIVIALILGATSPIFGNQYFQTGLLAGFYISGLLALVFFTLHFDLKDLHEKGE